jgi:RHS repeat-associated protein
MPPATTYASAIAYWPNLMVSQVTHGNGAVDTYANDPNAMRRPASITTVSGMPIWQTAGYVYDGAGDVTQIGAARFLYDGVSRLTSGTLVLGQSDTGPSATQTYAYDPFGNILSIGGTVARNTPTSAATNRLNGAGTSYDAAGNLTAWNGAVYEYDAFNQLRHYVSGSEEWLYMYDADDERLWSFKPGMPGAAPRFDRWTLRDLAGKVLRTYEASGYNWTGSAVEDDVYRDGLLLAAEVPGDTKHFHLDHLGTPRLITNRFGGQLAYHVYYPFGEEATAFNQDAERMKFTGHERDLASPAGAGDDLDYMHARHCSPMTGRFLSVDQRGSYVSSTRPQSWNRYAYARSNPMTLYDPDGEAAALFTGLFNDPTGGIGMVAKQVAGKPGVGRTKVFKHQQQEQALRFLMEQHKLNPKEPIFLAGHSQGAQSAVDVAKMLGDKGISVNLLITIDPAISNKTVSSNVQQAYNYFQTSNHLIGGDQLVAASGLETNVTNSEVQGVGHTDIDEAVANAVASQIEQAAQTTQPNALSITDCVAFGACSGNAFSPK